MNKEQSEEYQVTLDKSIDSFYQGDKIKIVTMQYVNQIENMKIKYRKSAKKRRVCKKWATRYDWMNSHRHIVTTCIESQTITID